SCGMQAYQQLSGFNTLMYYSATIFKQIGFDQPTAVGLIVPGTNFIFTFVALKWIDQVSHRQIMVWSAPGMIFGLVLAAIAFHYLTQQTNGVLVNNTSYPQSWSAIILSMIIYVTFYATSLGNISWQQGEFFSLEYQGLSTSLSTMTNWAANFLIGSTYLSLMAKITPTGAFGSYAS
ncbi:general substrate transporter, partial [Dendrothele bispora CBS 962.96]